MNCHICKLPLSEVELTAHEISHVALGILHDAAAKLATCNKCLPIAMNESYMELRAERIILNADPDRNQIN